MIIKLAIVERSEGWPKFCKKGTIPCFWDISFFYNFYKIIELICVPKLITKFCQSYWFCGNLYYFNLWFYYKVAVNGDGKNTVAVSVWKDPQQNLDGVAPCHSAPCERGLRDWICFIHHVPVSIIGISLRIT